MTPQEKQQLKARFFGQYIGCHFKHTCFSGSTTNRGIYIEIEDGVEYYRARDVFNKWYSLDLAQLILRPLSGIKDEEAVAWARLNPKFPVGVPIEVYVDFYGHKVVEPKAVGYPAWVIDIDKMLPLQFDYLRSINIALPFCGIDPVAEGFAILETTNQPKG